MRRCVASCSRERREQCAPHRRRCGQVTGTSSCPNIKGAQQDGSSRFRHAQRAFRSRTQGTSASRRDRQHGRHHDRVVRLPAVRHRHRHSCSASCSFPKSDPIVGVLEAFGVFFIGFVGRPIGAAIFGHYGDRIGRKATLIVTLLVTGIATVAVGCVPGYDSIGIWGAILLTVIRLIQGIGVGGEWGGSVLLAMEWAQHQQESRLPRLLAAIRRALPGCSWRTARCCSSVGCPATSSWSGAGASRSSSASSWSASGCGSGSASWKRRCSRRSSRRNASNACRCSRC